MPLAISALRGGHTDRQTNIPTHEPKQFQENQCMRPKATRMPGLTNMVGHPKSTIETDMFIVMIRLHNAYVTTLMYIIQSLKRARYSLSRNVITEYHWLAHFMYNFS